MSQRFVLAILNSQHTPSSRVSNITSIEIHGATDKDEFAIEHDGSILNTIKGSGIHNVSLPAGLLRLFRMSGNSPVTIFAYGTPTAR
jgi:hypothetical protein